MEHDKQICSELCRYSRANISGIIQDSLHIYYSKDQSSMGEILGNINVKREARMKKLVEKAHETVPKLLEQEFNEISMLCCPQNPDII